MKDGIEEALSYLLLRESKTRPPNARVPVLGAGTIVSVMESSPTFSGLINTFGANCPGSPKNDMPQFLGMVSSIVLGVKSSMVYAKFIMSIGFVE